MATVLVSAEKAVTLRESRSRTYLFDKYSREQVYDRPWSAITETGNRTEPNDQNRVEKTATGYEETNEQHDGKILPDNVYKQGNHYENLDVAQGSAPLGRYDALRGSHSWTYGAERQEGEPIPDRDAEFKQGNLIGPRNNIGRGAFEDVNASTPRTLLQKPETSLSPSIQPNSAGRPRALPLSTQHGSIHVARSWTSGYDTVSWSLTHEPSVVSMSKLPTHHSLDDGLCCICRTIDIIGLDKLEGSQITNEGIQLCAFTGLNQSMFYSLCAVCRAFASFLSSTLGPNSIHRPVSGKLLVMSAASMSGIHGTTPLPTILGISFDINPIRWDSVARCSTELQGLFLPMFDSKITDTNLCHGLPLEVHINFSRLREMLSSCAKSHKICQIPTQDFPVQARVIDCKTRKVVELHRGQRYLALSYVWGIRSVKNISRINSEGHGETLPTPLPQTIEDAITVTQRLGLRYLWCDRYCIEQFHSVDKKHQISQMARIYNCAVATICALGSDDNAGLPGVSQKRTLFPSFNIKGVSLAAIPAPILLQKQISASVWLTRGWYELVTQMNIRHRLTSCFWPIGHSKKLYSLDDVFFSRLNKYILFVARQLNTRASFKKLVDIASTLAHHQE